MMKRVAIIPVLLALLVACGGQPKPAGTIRQDTAVEPSPVASPSPSPKTSPSAKPSPAASPKPPQKTTVTYNVIEREDQSIAGRKRISAYIVAPDANTLQQRGETAIVAAQNLQKESGAKVVTVFLIPNGKKVGSELVFAGTNLALARYAPDGGGYSGDQQWIWEVQASDSTVNPQEIKIAERWYEEEGKYQIDDGFGGTITDEEALSKALAAEFGISPDDVGLPYFSLEDYPGPKS